MTFRFPLPWRRTSIAKFLSGELCGSRTPRQAVAQHGGPGSQCHIRPSLGLLAYPTYCCLRDHVDYSAARLPECLSLLRSGVIDHVPLARFYLVGGQREENGRCLVRRWQSAIIAGAGGHPREV